MGDQPKSSSRRGWFILALVSTLLVGVVVVAFAVKSAITYEVEHTDFNPAKPKHELFTDDKLADKKPVFDPELIDRRTIPNEKGSEWQLNASAAVISLDVPDIEGETAFEKLYANYAVAFKQFGNVLPSINMLDGKTKQFDDGLFAALELRMYQKLGQPAEGLVRKLLARVKAGGEAHDWLMAALSIGGLLRPGDVASTRSGDMVARFRLNTAESKAIGFYTWSDELRQAFGFLRFLQQEFKHRDGVAEQLARSVVDDAAVAKAYTGLLDYYQKLCNPFAALTLKDLGDHPGKSVGEIWRLRGLPDPPLGPAVHFLPYSTSSEVELFNRLFGFTPAPESTNLMVEFVKAIRSGKVDLKPRPNSGWYDYQVHALETFLLPERGKESEKLMLSKRYKQRMLEAFKALITKRRETHVRQFAVAANASVADMPPPGALRPRLRVEPNPTYYLRTARAYAFLQTFLQDAVPADDWESLVGLKQGGKRDKPLAEELEWIKCVFYGLHLISCEDIGMRDELLKDEVARPDDCYRTASLWLDAIKTDPDLAADTRVLVPILNDTVNDRARHWCTLGVRPVKLDAYYASKPKWRPRPEAGKDAAAWEEVGSTVSAHYVILTDEFGEFERAGSEPMTREEFRAICDKHATKEEILKALAK